jgi:PqqD family protein of HPr-rel-A system
MTVNNICPTERLRKLAVSDSGFVFDPQTGQSFSLNGTGLRSLNLLKNGSSIEDTATCLSQEYGVSPEVASTSVEAFLLQLERYL